MHNLEIEQEVVYTGNFESCVGFSYVISKVWPGGWCDLQLKNKADFYKGAYKEIMSVWYTEFIKANYRYE